MTKAGLSIIAVAILAGLVVAGVENLNDSRRNRNWSSTLADTVMKRYFNKPLQEYRVSDEFPLRSICSITPISRLNR